MHATIHGERTLTELDFARLTKRLHGRIPSELADLLAATEVVGSRLVPADVVTMYSQVELIALDTRRRQTLTICYPEDAEPAAGFISVLSPVGTSLLGLKAGSTARWCTPSGEEGSAELAAILFQPEASGDYTS
ncbi:MAG: GreA/GreB family elongation factor [Polaromonas sp.]